ncbi:MAG: class A beta-lactamase-related serine hydrolase, partial [Candidatus Dormibacteraeota bacterium]|nr:class A beta-lactamase-related serine hydrolase [Candidatus Dormibacteraeota bacterium]
MLRALGVLLFIAGVVVTSTSLALSDVRANALSARSIGLSVPAATAITAPHVQPDLVAVPVSVAAAAPVPVPALARPSTESLAQSVAQILSASPGQVAVSLLELGGPLPQSWSLNGSVPIPAASTYKLPVLMENAELVAAGRVSNTDPICFSPDEWEVGWFSDYPVGACYSRSELAVRAAHFSDNTAGHMLVQDAGGALLLNSYARAHGATASSFYLNNVTTSDDLAHLWMAESGGGAGGQAAQAWLHPLLTHTAFEDGIPAGVPASATVVHKTGELDPVVNDA